MITVDRNSPLYGSPHLVNPYHIIVEEVEHSPYKVVAILTKTGGREKNITPHKL
jgi:hypothetical protein